MKNSLKILATVAIVFLLSFSMYAQTDSWSGAWDTKYGKVTITKNGRAYAGTFPKGQLIDVREQDGVLIGKYTRLDRAPYQNSLGKKGEFRFILSDDKTKFDGYHKSETDTKWGSDNWNGIKVWGTVLPVIVSPNLPTVANPTWTGTWENNKGERFKIFDTEEKTSNTTVVVAKILIKKNGVVKTYDVIKAIIDLNKPRLFEGILYDKDGMDVGIISIEYGAINFNDFDGNIILFSESNSKYNISAHKTSEAKPNMNTY